MRKYIGVSLLLAVLACGCGGERDKDMYKGKDKPNGTVNEKR